MNKYREFVIYEIENGYILRVIPDDNPGIVNQSDCTSTYYKDTEALLKALKEILK